MSVINAEKSNTTKGFTLVELLVVISIIGTLSTTVIAAVNSARVRAENTARVQMMKQYKLAFELSYDADGYYPGFGIPYTLNPGEYYCIGDYGTDTCRHSPLPPLATENAILSNALERFISKRATMPPITVNSIFFGTYQLDGPVYVCGTFIAPNCLSLKTQWTMVGFDANCGFGITSTPSDIGVKFTGGNLTTCSLNLR